MRWDREMGEGGGEGKASKLEHSINIRVIPPN